jgi:hypothetical protein
MYLPRVWQVMFAIMDALCPPEVAAAVAIHRTSHRRVVTLVDARQILPR